MKDILGVACSGLCLLHCILAPLFLLAGGSSAFFIVLSGEWFHHIVVVPVVLFAILSLPPARRQHGQNLPVLFGIVGTLLLMVSLALGEALEMYLTLLASSLLITAHLYNRRLTRSIAVLQASTS